MKYEALKAELEKRGLETAGEKQVLVGRLSKAARRENLAIETVASNLAEIPEVSEQIGNVLEEPDLKAASEPIENQPEGLNPKPADMKSRSFAGGAASMFNKLTTNASKPVVSGIAEERKDIEH